MIRVRHVRVRPVGGATIGNAAIDDTADDDFMISREHYGAHLALEISQGVIHDRHPTPAAVPGDAVELAGIACGLRNAASSTASPGTAAGVGCRSWMTPWLISSAR